MIYELLLKDAHPTAMSPDIRLSPINESTYGTLKKKNDYNEPVSFAIYKMNGFAHWVQLKQISESVRDDKCCLTYETVSRFSAPAKENQKMMNGAFEVRIQTADGCEANIIIQKWEEDIAVKVQYTSPYTAPINDCGEKIGTVFVTRKYRWSHEYKSHLPLFKEVI